MFKLFTLIILATVTYNVSGSKISPILQKQVLQGFPTLPLNFVIKMTNSTDQILNNLKNTVFATRNDRLNAVTTALKSHATQSQKSLLGFLGNQSNIIKSLKSLWITNEVLVVGAIATLLDIIAARSDVIGINPEQYLNLQTPFFDLNPTSNAEWGIVKIQAPEASAISNGTGIRVASIDTGVRSTHEALRDNFVNQYGWFDPYYGTTVPYDSLGHGTHTMGTLVGKGIGVAQGAQWMTCKGCDGSVCSYTALKLCGQFMLCPTLPNGSSSDCTQAPHLVSNSYGAGQKDPWFDSVINAWHAAGIVPIFSAGNGGPTCNTITSPADSQADVIAVGSTTNIDSVEITSSQGPSAFLTIKPDISAPGFLIRSSYNTSDTQYASATGTSMACPHVSGTIAILLSANSGLSYTDIKNYLNTGVDTLLITNPASNCSGKSGTSFPNNNFGSGRLNALNSLNLVLDQQ